MSHQVALAFEDGVTRFIDCAEDQTVADASYRARINIPLDCRDGACGTCKALCESGDFDGGFYIEDALSPDEEEQGYVLPCSMKPRSDLVLQIASTSAVAKTQAATYQGTLTGLDRLSPTTIALTVQTPDRDKLAFLPGQYVNIEVPGSGETRSYSFSSAPSADELTFLVKITPGGLMSEHLTEKASVGDEITFTGPLGSFFLRESERPVLLLAGGTGLAPILSVLRKLRDCGSERPVHLVYGVTTDDDVVELETIEQLGSELSSFTWDYCVADPDSTAPNKGYVTGLLGPEHLHDGDVAVYLCGPPPMVEAVRKHFADSGITPTGFYYEKFALSHAPEDAAPVEEVAAPVTVAEPEEPAGDTGSGSGAAETVVLAESGDVADGVPAETPVQAPAAQADEDAEPAAARTAAVGTGEALVLAADGRTVAGQETFPQRETAAVSGAPAPWDVDVQAATLRTIAGQTTFAAPGGGGTVLPKLDEGDIRPAPEGRSVAGQETFGGRDIEPLAAPSVAVPSTRSVPSDARADLPATATSDGYEIGEEHPGIHESDAIFEARQALELGAVELTIGRLSSRQLTGYRLLAEATLPYVDGETFTDAAAYTDTNAAFHDYLFGQTGNAHLLSAYRALGVKGHMEETLRNATWCHPRCATDHVEIVEAVEAGDRETARRLVVEHAGRSKETTRRAMLDLQQARRPKFLSPGRFDGQVVLVTGAAQGIGAQVARRIAAEGGSVVLADRSELAGEVASELTSDGLQALAVTGDLEQYDGAQGVVEQAIERFGRVDVLVNNVGGAINFKPFTEFTDTEIRAEIDRSLMTTLHACRAALPGMVERGSGVIVNVSSAATRGINRIPYSAAKGGINAITASLAFEYADQGVRVVATAPGGTEAPARRISRGTPEPRNDQERAWFQAHIDQTLETSLLGRYGTIDEQAAAICFLASPEAGYITGTVLPVAGGDLG